MVGGLDDAEIGAAISGAMMNIYGFGLIGFKVVLACANNAEMASMLSTAIRTQVGVKSEQLRVSEHEKAATYDAIFIPIRFMSQFRSIARKHTLVIPLFTIMTLNLSYR